MRLTARGVPQTRSRPSCAAEPHGDAPGPSVAFPRDRPSRPGQRPSRSGRIWPDCADPASGTRRVGRHHAPDPFPTRVDTPCAPRGCARTKMWGSSISTIEEPQPSAAPRESHIAEGPNPGHAGSPAPNEVPHLDDPGIHPSFRLFRAAPRAGDRTPPCRRPCSPRQPTRPRSSASTAPVRSGRSWTPAPRAPAGQAP